MLIAIARGHERQPSSASCSRRPIRSCRPRSCEDEIVVVNGRMRTARAARRVAGRRARARSSRRTSTSVAPFDAPRGSRAELPGWHVTVGTPRADRRARACCSTNSPGRCRWCCTSAATRAAFAAGHRRHAAMRAPARADLRRGQRARKGCPSCGCRPAFAIGCRTSSRASATSSEVCARSSGAGRTRRFRRRRSSGSTCSRRAWATS